MGPRAPERLLLIWTLMGRLCCGILPEEIISVRDSELKPCAENNRVCVTQERDCRRPPPSSSQTPLNMSCYYQEAPDGLRSVSCSWRREPQSQASLIFTSRSRVLSCLGIFNPKAVLGVTARIRSHLTGRDDWSGPQKLELFRAVKPFRPALALRSSTADSLHVWWRSGFEGHCRLRFRPNDTGAWTEVTELIAAHEGQDMNYTISDLRPFTAYKAAAACRMEFGFWSDWSSDTTWRTLDRVPSEPEEICYRLEKTGDEGSLLLHLIWMTFDPSEAAGRVLGYRVSIGPHEGVHIVNDTAALLVVKEGNYSVTVQAFNTAGVGPAARLQVDTRTQSAGPSVRNLWISSSLPEKPELLVQWTFPPPVPPGRHVAVHWRSEKNPSRSRWLRVDGSNSSATITDADPDESYLVSVFPIHQQRCGPPRSLAAGLQPGALVEAFDLKVAGVTKTTVTVRWAWQRKSGPVRVGQYRAMLRTDADAQTATLWPDQQQLTFSNLTPSTRYSLLLLADDVTRSITPVDTSYDEVPVVATATPLLLLVVMAIIISILSRTLYKSYFVPPVSSPWRSSAGQWLLNPNLQKCGERNLLDILDFQVPDLLLVVPGDRLGDGLFLRTSAVKLDAPGSQPITGRDFDGRPIAKQQLISLQAVFTSEEFGETDEVQPAVLHQGRSTFQTPELLTDFPMRPEPLERSEAVYEVEYLTNGCFRAEPPAGEEITDP